METFNCADNIRSISWVFRFFTLFRAFGKYNRGRVLAGIASALAGFMLIPSLVYGAATTVDDTIGSDNYVLEDPSQRKIVRDSDGYWYVIYVSYNSANGEYEVKLARSTDGSSWSKATLFGDGGIIYDTEGAGTDDFYNPSMDVNASRNQIHLIVNAYISSNKVLYSKCTNLTNWNASAGWTQADGGTSTRYDDLASSAGNVSYTKPAVAVDSNDYAHAVYENFGTLNDYQITYRRFNGTSWTSENELTTTAGDKENPSIDVGYNDVLHIAYRDGLVIKYTKSSDYSSFDSPVTVLSDSSQAAYGPSLVALEGENKVFVVGYFYWLSTTYKLKQNYYSGAGWEGATNVEINSAYYYPGPLVGANSGVGTDHKILSMDYSPQDIYYYTWNDSNSNFETQTDTTNNAGATGDVLDISLEEHKPMGVTNMGYVWYNSSDNTLYFDTLTGMENGNAVPGASTLKSPYDNAKLSEQSPALISSATDTDGDDLVYQIQLDDDYDFLSTAIDDTSDSPSSGTFYNGSDSGDTSPFTQGQNVVYVPTGNLTNGTTYYWRARAIDPSGSNTYSSWSEIRSITIDTSLSDPTWFQTMADQWDNTDNPATYSYAQTNASDQVELPAAESGTVYGSTDDGYVNYAGGSYTGSTTDSWYYVGYYNSTNRYRGYLRFDLSAVSDVSSATISVYVKAENLGAGEYIELYDISSWGGTLGGSPDWSLIDSGTKIDSTFIENGDSAWVTSADITSYVTGGEVNDFGLWSNPGGAQANIQMYFAEQGSPDYRPKLDWSSGNDTGYVLSAPIDYSELEALGSTGWNALTWTQSGGTGGTLKIKVYYDNSGTPTIVPDGALAGNSSGFQDGDGYDEDSDANEGQIDISGLSTSTYATLYLRAEFATGSEPPDLDDWGVSGSGGSPTAVDLISFSAQGEDGGLVKVSWETAKEINTVGFNLYRSVGKEGPYSRINSELIPGAIYSVAGRSYSFSDSGVSPGLFYYYKLEELDRTGKKTLHGPICVDWDADGMQDDWEILYGLDPTGKDSDLDYDGDGLSNYAEYLEGTDPWSSDTDGDGISDGEDRQPTGPTGPLPQPRGDDHGARGGFRIVQSDDSGMVIELATSDFSAKSELVSGTSYQKISLRDYFHGWTEEVGSPQLPLKGLFIDLPEDASPRLEIETVESTDFKGYRVYPTPQSAVSEEDSTRLRAKFSVNQKAYRKNAFYPSAAVELGETARFRHQKKAQIKFFPVQFNPATGVLKLNRVVRVKVTYEHKTALKAMRNRKADRPEMRWLPESSNPIYKVYVGDEGIYRLSYEYLSSHGVDVDAISDTRRIKLYYLGSEVPLHVDGEGPGDHSFDPGDYIEFYAQDLNTKYTRTNVYWLVLDGAPGLRMPEVNGANGSSMAPASFLSTLHHENDAWYLGTASGPDERDRWFDPAYVHRQDNWGIDVRAELSLPMPEAVEGDDIVPIRLALDGFIEGSHSVDVSLNDIYLGRVSWSGQGAHEAELTANSTDLNKATGQNVLTLQAAVDPDIVLVDWVETTYPRGFEAENDRLKFTAEPGEYRFQLSGFQHAGVEVLDITNPAVPARITNFDQATMRFEDSPAVFSTYLAMVPEEPAEIAVDAASDLRDPGNRADYLIITHQDLSDAVQPLAAHRASEGLTVQVVLIEDIYDEFSYGIATPHALKDFLQYAYNSWSAPAPRYVLLVGDATYDYKNNLGLGTINYVPTYLLSTEHLGETASDVWFAQISGDDLLPDLYIGRLPASSPAEAELMISKIIGYENAANTQTWEKHLIFSAGDGLEEGEAETFRAMNEAASSLVPELYSISKNYGTIQPIAGALLVNYSGHGYYNGWRINGATRGVDQILSLLNTEDKPAFFVTMTCLNGYFLHESVRSLAENLLTREQGGAVAVLAPTGMTIPEGQELLDEGVFEALFEKDYRDLGRAIGYARAHLLANSTAEEDVANTFLLFGDPAMELKIPAPYGEGDRDGDGLPDNWEVLHSLSVLINDAPGDRDGDGYTNLQEYLAGTDPDNVDTDGDGMPDGWELDYGLNALANDAQEDPDGDRRTNLEEYLAGTNPVQRERSNIAGIRLLLLH
jgi:hypothetical protein